MTAPTPHDHAERAPEGEVTAAVERATKAWSAIPGYPTPYRARVALAAALDVEEMARVLQASERATGDTSRTWDEIPERWRETYRVDARYLRTALLGGDQ